MQRWQVKRWQHREIKTIRTSSKSHVKVRCLTRAALTLRWKGGKVHSWISGEVGRWRGGKVERWKGGWVERMPKGVNAPNDFH